MSTIQIRAQVSSEELLQAVKQLPTSELEQFANQMTAFRLRHLAPVLSLEESDLLLKINQGIPASVQQRYSELIAKRQDETLTGEEHAELLLLTEQVEQAEAERVTYLAALACLRHTTLPRLMQDLGIEPPTDA